MKSFPRNLQIPYSKKITLKTSLFVLLTLALTIAFFTSSWAKTPGYQKSQFVYEKGYSPDQFLVKFKPGIAAETRHSINVKHGVKEKDFISDINVHILTVPRTKTVKEMINVYRKNPNVDYAEPDYILETLLTPNDPCYPGQWGLPAVSAPVGWDVTTGNASVIVAVVDSGVDSTHPDLQGKVIAGYDFVNNDSDPSDDRGHGTKVAGIIAANTDNRVGIAGINWNGKILSEKALDQYGYGLSSNIAKAITHATDNGAKVINLSLGGTSNSSTLKSAVDYAYNKGVTLVAAAGNSGDNTIFYPAGYSNVIAVGSVNIELLRSSFSSYGPHLDVVAPGELIYTTRPNSEYVRSTGTSFSAPFVSALASLLLSLNQQLTPSQIQDIIQKTAKDAGDPGWDQFYGWGIMNIEASLKASSENVSSGNEIQVSEPQTPAVEDIEPPMVRILYPSSGMQISGKILIKADAYDNVSVSKVNFYVDGAFIGSVSSEPYEIILNTRGIGNGIHLIYTVAHDASGNTSTSDIVSVEVLNQAKGRKK